MSDRSAEGSVTGNREFDYAKGRPNLYRLMRYKQSLAAQHGVARGFEVFRDTIPAAATDRLVRAPLVGERDHALREAEVFVETHAAGEAFTHAPPRVVGAGNHRSLSGVTRSFYLACHKDARLRGRSALAEAGGEILLDRQYAEAARLDDELDWDPIIFQASADRAWILAPDQDRAWLQIDSAFNLMGAHTDFFGHWMCEYLPKFMLARLSGHAPRVPVLIDADMPASHREALEFLYPGEIEVIEIPAFAPVRVAHLWSAPCLSYMPLHEIRNERFRWDDVAMPAARLAPVLREMGRRADLALGGGAGVERIFLARRDFRHRKIVNRAAVEAAAVARGFYILHPENLSFADQVAAVRGARFVLAPEGSALFLLYFARPGLKLCALSHPLTDVLADYNAQFGRQGVEMTVFTGPLTGERPGTPHDGDYEIDAIAFARYLDEWLGGSGGRRNADGDQLP